MKSYGIIGDSVYLTQVPSGKEAGWAQRWYAFIHTQIYIYIYIYIYITGIVQWNSAGLQAG
jgi:hypothetical protein